MAVLRTTAVIGAGLFLVFAASAAGACDHLKTKADKQSAAVQRKADAQIAGCLTQSGSRIPLKGTGCTAVGRSYSNQEVALTGATTVAGALRLLDPSITINH